MKRRPRRLLLAVLALPFAAAALAVFVAWLGLVDVRASSGHWAVTNGFLHLVMRSSVRTDALGVDAPPLPRDALRPAAGHFARGCAICHGAPGVPQPPATLGMLPPPPALGPRVGTWSDAELHGIVMDGIRYSGMPAWPELAREDEGWMMVAFLRALPGLTPSGYRQLTSGAEGKLPPACSRCHGPDGRGGGPFVPRLAGQNAAYLEASLAAYASRRRASGIMAEAAAGLSPADRAALARALAALPAAVPEDAAAAADDAGPPPAVATGGNPASGVPACLACHGEPRRNPAFPVLDGQPAPYLAAQLRLFRDGVRGGGPYAMLMTFAADELTDAEIDDLAAWFARR